MTEPRQRAVSCLRPEGFRQMAYVEWGEPDNDRVVVCVHGLARNGRDFDWLARVLSTSYRVMCPDVLGRGRSDWLTDPQGYTAAHYTADMAALLARADVASVDWVGTSMGGIVGMMLAAADKSPIRRLVLNDVGAFVPAAALTGILSYFGTDPRFATRAEGEQYLRRIYAGFGTLSAEQWRHIADHGLRPDGNGRFALAYDPRIREPITAQPLEDADLWAVWDRISCPVLVVRGAESPLLTADTVAEMRRRGPGCTVYEVADAGHAPALMDAAQTGRIADWLRETGMP